MQLQALLTPKPMFFLFEEKSEVNIHLILKYSIQTNKTLTGGWNLLAIQINKQQQKKPIYIILLYKTNVFQKKLVSNILIRSIIYTKNEHDTLCISVYIYNNIHVYYNQYLFWLL